MALKGLELIEKRNVLNEIRNNSMSLQELRFFSIYLSKINARVEQSRVVKFSLEQFCSIMEIKANPTQIKNNAIHLLQQIVSVPTERGGFEAFQLFKQVTVDQDDFGKWFVEIDAHDKALPLMFNFKKDYFTYELWNALRLKSSNQLRLYELLKQYERIGTRQLLLNDLKAMLGLKPTEYPRWDRFKSSVLDVCQKALKEYTDICFEYEPFRKNRSVVGVTFKIYKNDSFTNPLALDEFIEQNEIETTCADIPSSTPEDKYNNQRVQFFSSAVDYEFTEIEINSLISDYLVRILPNDPQDLERHAFLQRKYNELNIENQNNKIVHRFKYLRAMLEQELLKHGIE